MALELTAPRPWTRPLWLQTLQRYAPLGLAPSALLVRANRPDLQGVLATTIARMAEAHQGFNDAVDVPEDLRAGHHTLINQRARDRDAPPWLTQLLPAAAEESAQGWRALRQGAMAAWCPGWRAYCEARLVAQAHRLDAVRGEAINALLAAAGARGS